MMMDSSATTAAPSSDMITVDNVPRQLMDPHHACNRTTRKMLSVTTSRPSNNTAMTAGALAMVDPQSGSVSSSLTISGDLSSNTASNNTANSQFGVSSVSLFPSQLSRGIQNYCNGGANKAPLGIAYGGKATAAGNTNNKDCAAMLVSLHPSHPKVHWKARLPEANLTAKLILSMCGHYAIAGGASGCLYVWYTLSGELIATIRRAHYRAVAVLCSVGERFVLTGGHDGMVHLWALRDLVQQQHHDSSNDNQQQQQVLPIRTWAQHAVPITALAVLSDDSRVVSASQDGMILVLETFSEQVLAQIQLPQGVASLVVRNQRIYAGGQLGTIYCLDMDQYSLQQTIQLGAKTTTAQSQQLSYQTTLTGHLDAVTALAAWRDETNNNMEYVASGDAMGVVRIWDLESRVCVRIVQPWRTTTGTTPDKKKAAQQAQHSITSLVVLELTDEESAADSTDHTSSFASSKLRGGGSNKSRSSATTLTEMLPPLQKYPMQPPEPGQVKWTPVLLWQTNVTSLQQDEYDKPQRSRADIALEKAERFGCQNPWRKNKRGGTTKATRTITKAAMEPSGDDDDDAMDIVPREEERQEELERLRAAEKAKDDELQRLRQQLEEANSTIDRWQKVNNELVAQLKRK